MSDAFRCDLCKDYEDGQPSAQLTFDHPMGGYPDPPVIEGYADLCNDCWHNMIGRLGLEADDE